MLKTGMMKTGQNTEDAHTVTRATVLCPPAISHFRKWLGGGLVVSVFMFSTFAPVSVDLTKGEISTGAALAGEGDGNYGIGKGNGGPNGKNPGKGGDDDDEDDDSDEGDGQAGAPPINPVTEDHGGQDTGADAASGMAEIDFAEISDAVTELPPVASAASLPTIGQVFAMGDESALSADEELKMIGNGWNAAK